jgi:hypothetical protein
MESRFVIPQEINTLIISYPQCVDNQAVPFDIYNIIANDRDVDLESFLDSAAAGSNIRKYRQYWEFQKREYNRSFIFSRKVVVNRTAFWNNPVFIRAILGEEKNSLINLLNNEVILPFLFNEQTFDEEPKDYGVVDKGKEAMKELTNSPDLRVTCIRFSHNPKLNKDWIRKLGSRFTKEFLDAVIDPESLLTPAMVLLGKKSETDEEVKELSSRMLTVSKYINENLGKERRLTNRDGVYENFIVQPNTKTQKGKYRSDKFTFQLKQWVDAIYNSNLPSMLGMLTFTPINFPTPYDLQISWTYNPGYQNQGIVSGSELFNDMLERMKTKTIYRQWNSFIKEAVLDIPDPHTLTHQDIEAIRGWDEWDIMMTGLEKYLQDPSGHKDFWEVYNEFSKKLGSWNSEKRTSEQLERVERYIPAILVAYKIGQNLTMGLLIGHDLAIPYSNFAKLPDLDENNVRGILEISFLFVNRFGVDWKRSQNMRQIKRNVLLPIDDVFKFWQYLNNLKAEMPSDLIGLGENLDNNATTEEY